MDLKLRNVDNLGAFSKTRLAHSNVLECQNMRASVYWIAFFICCVCNSARCDVIFDFDYTYDSGFFASGSQARNTLEAAGGYFQSILGDSLSAITPSGSNTWSGAFSNPSDGSNASFNGSVSANTLKIFVGARDLGGSVLGQAGPGGFSASGNQAWFNNLIARGQSGALLGNPTDFATWGGSMVIDSDSNWNFNHTIAPTAGQSDLYSVILHELGHVLGYGTSGSWNSLIQNGQFTGAASVASNGGLVALDPGLGHWQNGTLSTVDGIPQEAAMDPSIFVGTRKLFTHLDLAGLSDIGWQVTAVPEPAYLSLLLLGLAVNGIRRDRRVQ